MLQQLLHFMNDCISNEMKMWCIRCVLLTRFVPLVFLFFFRDNQIESNRIEIEIESLFLSHHVTSVRNVTVVFRCM